MQQLTDLPQEVQQKIFSPELIAAQQEATNRFKLDDELFIVFIKILNGIFLKVYQTSELKELFKTKLNLNEENAKELFIFTIDKILKPIESWLNINLEELKKQSQPTISVEPEKKNEIKKVSIPALSQAVPPQLNQEVKINDSILTKEEISELAAQPCDMSGAGLDKQAKTDEMILDIMSHFVFPDPVATSRLKNIIINYLKDIRDEIGTKDVLTRSFKVGGMEFDNSQTDFLISVLKNKKDLLHQFNSETQKVAAPLPLVDGGLTHGLKTAADFVVKPTEGESAKESEKESKRVRFEEGAMVGLETFQCPLPEREIAGPTAVKFLPSEAETKNESLSLKIKDIPYIEPESTSIIETIQKMPEPTKIESIVTDLGAPKEAPVIMPGTTTFESMPNAIPFIERSPEPKFQGKTEDLFTEPSILKRSLPDEAQRERRIVEEVKVTPKIYGPIDELRTVRLVDWRRWKNPREAANRIKDKINLLAEDSLLKASQGIKAWKESEVNRLYLEIGLEALEKEKTIEEVISSRLKENRQALTFEDFNTISELNEKLRF